MSRKQRYRFPAWAFAGLIVLLAGSVATMRPSLAADLAQSIDRLKPSVVGVGTVMPTRKPQAKLRGTGFAVGDGRYVITNAHVLPQILDAEHFEELAVFTGKAQKKEPRRARKVAMDHAHDLALLALEGPPLQPVRFGESESVREGERYAFMGFPIGSILGMYPVTHVGIVAALTPIAIPRETSEQLDPRVVKRLRSPYKVFQLDATAYPGNSGSPLFDPATGEVVGVINMVFVQGNKEALLENPSGITYAIPGRYARQLMRRGRQ